MSEWVGVTQSCLTLRPHGLYNSPWNSPGQHIGVGSRSLLQGIFPAQGWNPGLPHCRWILYHLSHKGSPSCFLHRPNRFTQKRFYLKEHWVPTGPLMRLPLSDQGERVPGCGGHGSQKSLWLKNKASACPAASSSEAKDRWCMFETECLRDLFVSYFS